MNIVYKILFCLGLSALSLNIEAYESEDYITEDTEIEVNDEDDPDWIDDGANFWRDESISDEKDEECEIGFGSPDSVAMFVTKLCESVARFEMNGYWEVGGYYMQEYERASFERIGEDEEWYYMREFGENYSESTYDIVEDIHINYFIRDLRISKETGSWYLYDNLYDEIEYKWQDICYAERRNGNFGIKFGGIELFFEVSSFLRKIQIQKCSRTT